MTKIKNAHTLGMEPKDYTDFSTWIAFWESEKKPLRYFLQSKQSSSKFKCSKCEEEKEWREFDGAHVLKVDSVDKKKYIYPLCQTCNRGHDETSFEAIELLLLDIPPKKA